MNTPPKYEDVAAQLDAALGREAALREEIETAKQVQEATDAIVTMVDGQRDHWIEKCGLLKQRLTVAERRESEAREELLDLSRKLDVFYSRSHGIKNLSAIEDANDKSKALQQRLTVAEQRLSQVEGACDLAMSAIDDDERGANFVKIIQAIKDKAALKPDAEPTIEVARQSLSFENQRIQPARFHCLACGEYHEGSGNLPCPKMKPMSGVKP